MEKDSSVASIVHASNAATATVPIVVGAIVMVPPTVDVNVPSTAFASIVPVLPAYVNPSLKSLGLRFLLVKISSDGRSVYIPH